MLAFLGASSLKAVLEAHFQTSMVGTKELGAGMLVVVLLLVLVL